MSVKCVLFMVYMRTMLAHIYFFDISSWAFCLSLCCQDETTPRFPGKIYDFYTTGVEGKEGNDILWVFYTSRSKLRLSFASVSLKHQANTLFQTRGRLTISILSGFTSSVWNSPFEFSIVFLFSFLFVWGTMLQWYGLKTPWWFFLS